MKKLIALLIVLQVRYNILSKLQAFHTKWLLFLFPTLLTIKRGIIISVLAWYTLLIITNSKISKIIVMNISMNKYTFLLLLCWLAYFNLQFLLNKPPITFKSPIIQAISTFSVALIIGYFGIGFLLISYRSLQYNHLFTILY